MLRKRKNYLGKEKEVKKNLKEIYQFIKDNKDINLEHWVYSLILYLIIIWIKLFNLKKD